MAEATKNWEHPVVFTEEDIERISQQTPFIGNFAPNGIHKMEALSQNGGTPIILRYMLENGYLNGSQMTLTGKTLGEELLKIDALEYKTQISALLAKNIILPFKQPFLDRGHLVLLQGNMGSGWTKVSNAGLEEFRGKAVVFESEQDFLKNYQTRGIQV
jgi:dihydroxy-acid dehydratase